MYACVVFNGNAVSLADLVSLAALTDTLPLAQCSIKQQSGILGMANGPDSIMVSAGWFFQHVC